MSAFADLGLTEKTLNGIRSSGYTTPTPVQAATIPVVLRGGDVTGCAQTGTGKTASFVLPTIERLSQRHVGGSGRKGRRNIRALIITPTRELAAQVEASVRTYGAGTGLRSISVYGGVGMRPQIDAFRRGVDIVIATPGRLLDHLSSRRIDLSHVETLILDEADRMFDMGFINDIRKIVKALPESRQTLLFSATMPKEVRALAETIQRDPEFIEIGRRRDPAKSVHQSVYGVKQNDKVDLLFSIIESERPECLLVFTRTKYRADKVTRKLEQMGITAVAIHSNRTQNQRAKALKGFRDGRYRVLVGTDVAARGLDVDGITHVINFDIPGTVEDYIHRIGRTGRAEATGEALTFVAPEDRGALRAIERTTGATLERRSVEGLAVELGSTSSGRHGGSSRGDDDRDSGSRDGASTFRRSTPPQNWKGSRGGGDRRRNDSRGAEGRRDGGGRPDRRESDDRRQGPRTEKVAWDRRDGSGSGRPKRAAGGPDWSSRGDNERPQRQKSRGRDDREERGRGERSRRSDAPRSERSGSERPRSERSRSERPRSSEGSRDERPRRASKPADDQSRAKRKKTRSSSKERGHGTAPSPTKRGRGSYKKGGESSGRRKTFLPKGSVRPAGVNKES